MLIHVLLFYFYQPVREEDKNGEILNYTLNYTLSMMNETFSEVTFPGSLSFIMRVPCEKSVTLSLGANNKNGSSPLSQLHIPPPDAGMILIVFDDIVLENNELDMP